MNVSIEVARRMVDGDEKAFEEVYFAYRRLVFYICLGYMGEREDAEDAFQDCFACLWANRGRIESAKALHSYIVRLARSRCLDALRKKREQLGLEADLIPSFDPKRLDYLLPNSLSPEQKAMISLRIGFGLKYKEVGEAMGLSESYAKKKCLEALRQAKKAYSDK